MDEKSFGLNHGFVSLPWHIVWGIIGVIVPRREMCILLLLWMSMIAVELRPVWKPGLMSTRVIFGFDCPGIIPLGIIVFLGSTLFHYRWHLSPVKKNPKFNNFLKQSEGGRRPTERSVFNFFPKVGCFIGKILGLRQTKKGVKIVATALATMHARRWLSLKVAPPDRQDFGLQTN